MRCAAVMFKVRDNSSPKMDFKGDLRCPRDGAPFLTKPGIALEKKKSQTNLTEIFIHACEIGFR